MKKISEWLSEMDGHDAISVELSRPAFEKETGKPWPTYLKGRPVKAALRDGRKDYKGLQSWRGDKSHHVIGAFDIAAALADRYAKYVSPCYGRGSAFQDCLRALREAGL